MGDDILAAMASLSVSGNIGGHGASVSINMDLGGSHHSHSDSEPRSPPQHPVRPTERAELEDEIKKEVDDQMDQMFAELKEDERLEDDTAMNEVQLMRLKLIKSLMHDLNIKSDDIKEAGEGDSEKPAGWNKSIFVEKKGRHAQAANTKKAGFREFKADPWYRKMSRYG